MHAQLSLNFITLQNLFYYFAKVYDSFCSLLLCKGFANYSTHFVCLFVRFFLQQNSKTAAQMVMKFLESIKAVTRKN